MATKKKPADEVVQEAPAVEATRAQSATVEDKIDDLIKRKDHALHAASAEAVKKQHDRGKLTARERIDLLLDPGSFVETDRMARHRTHGFGIERHRPLSDAVVTGWGRSTAARSSCSARTSWCSAARSVK